MVIERPTLFVDPRIGSGDLVGPLRILGVPAEHLSLDYGDVSFTGNGPDNRPVPIGVEIKTAGDLLGSLVSERLQGHQLPGLIDYYERAYLLVEGILAADSTRELLLFKRGKWAKAPFGEKPWVYENVMSWRFSMERAGLRLGDSADRRTTAAWIAALYNNWTKPWESHRSHQVIRLKTLEEEGGLSLDTVTPQMRVAAGLISGLGFKRAKSIEERFNGVRQQICESTVKDYQAIDGIGKKLATRIIEEIDRRK